MSDDVSVEKQGRVLVLRMDRPEKKNAITSAMYRTLADGLRQGFADDGINAIAILGVKGAFSAGNDLADFLTVAQTGERVSVDVFDFLEAIITSKKPVLAGVDGLAIGVGTTMLMHCDHVVASYTSLFKTPFVSLGLVPEAGSSLLAPRLMSYQQAFAMLAMGEGISADDAKNAGLVNHLTDSESLEEVTLARAAEVAALPVEAMRLTRDLVRGNRADVLARMKEEIAIFSERLQSEEAKAAFMAFLGK